MKIEIECNNKRDISVKINDKKIDKLTLFQFCAEVGEDPFLKIERLDDENFFPFSQTIHFSEDKDTIEESEIRKTIDDLKAILN